MSQTTIVSQVIHSLSALDTKLTVTKLETVKEERLDAVLNLERNSYTELKEGSCKTNTFDCLSSQI